MAVPTEGDVVGTIGTVLVAIIGGVVATIQSRNNAKNPLTADQLLARMNEQDERIDELINGREADRLERDKDRRRINHLENAISRWNSWYADIVLRWDYHRDKTHPPTNPDSILEKEGYHDGP